MTTMLLSPEILHKLLELPREVEVRAATTVNTPGGVLLGIELVGDGLPEEEIVNAEYSEKTKFDRFTGDNGVAIEMDNDGLRHLVYR